jgi:hypothetical protein
MSQLARNAAGLAELRTNGFKPDLPILVSFVGDLPHTNTILHAKAGERYDWRCLAGLEVEVFVNRSVGFAAVIEALADIAACVPAHMTLTYTEGPRIECGEWRVIDDFALFDWLPMVVGPTSYAEASLIRKRLNSELGKAIPLPYEQALPLFLQAQREANNGEDAA